MEAVFSLPLLTDRKDIDLTYYASAARLGVLGRAFMNRKEPFRSRLFVARIISKFGGICGHESWHAYCSSIVRLLFKAVS